MSITITPALVAYAVRRMHESAARAAACEASNRPCRHNLFSFSNPDTLSGRPLRWGSFGSCVELAAAAAAQAGRISATLQTQSK